MNAPSERETGIGASVRRKEDYRFITGSGKYTDDVQIPGQTYAYFLRSPHAHAAIRSIDSSAAQSAPGVIAVFTGEDLAADKVAGVPCGWLITDVNGEPMKEPAHPALAQGKVRYVGDQVAIVIASTYLQAKDAAELIQVDYDILPAVADARDALKDGAPVLHDIAPDNKCYTWSLGDKAAVDAAFGNAHHVTRIELINNRLVPNAIEPRAAVAQYSRGDDSYTLYVANQNPHVERLLLTAFVLSLPEHKMRVIAPDVGGGFGSKIFLYAEDVVLAWASKKVNRPVKWTAERSESFLSDAHGRDHATVAEMATDQNGKFLAMRVHTVANLGAYLSTFATSVPTILYATLLAGQYATPHIYAEIDGVFTNTTPVDAYRGAGRPEAAYVVERLVSAVAREMKIDDVELRRRNFITAFPYQTPVALEYDTGDFHACLDGAIELADVAGFPARREEAKRRGKLRGLGYSTYIEACGLAPSNIAGALGARAGLYEVGEIRVHPTGSVTVFTGSHSHGQGHETTFAQIVSTRLGIPFDQVDIVHGDTGRVPFGMGTYGSRSLAVGGSAIVKALDKIEAKGKQIAAHLMEASAGDIEFKDGKFTIAGTDRSVPFAQVALAAYVPHNYPLDRLEPGLNETAFYDPTNFTYPAGTHICEVEVDPETGAVEVVAMTAVDDFGKVINPMIVEGQVHGGLAQGIGQALLENCVYDHESGQLLSGSYMDYAMPRAEDLPSFRVDSRVTPCTHNPLGAKGCGEAGAIGSPPAVINAVIDALSPLGVTHLDMPASPERVWNAIRSARQSKPAQQPA
ncbi:MAG TPA: xanthine dehydrogenase family protein molybdopterin-binding subunit [Noviherbaspirillum sp.]|jgi:carbon-monoxide dehydrogenase large subunit|uniref:xanthine dehydrogenase family protein molybdopterin-binding subunit n=1 Tax=Noviherbaspirillum sp. TaxID=1926288 RepID=UPI002DDD35D7|nr:xanthine dehydrogenase family protein molybdopterin-binding subunit [Noviherbaspirillum sp.]HEV2612213.1 xanthine dehydrogenase family protein molybdopterin-binding subunit [Noviherbaspirillum sp.]